MSPGSTAKESHAGASGSTRDLSPNTVDIRVLETNGWYAKLAPDLKAEIVLRANVRHYKAGTLLYRTGAAASGFYIVISGEVGLEHLSRSGKFAFYHSHGPGALFGMLSELDDSPRFSDARALKDSRILQVPHVECQDMIRRLPAMYPAFVAMMCEHLHTTLAMLVEQHSAPPRAQVAGILVNLASRRVDGQHEATSLTHETMAAMAGISRQTAAKVLHAFRDEGLIDLQYGKVRPLDLRRLQQIARG